MKTHHRAPSSASQGIELTRKKAQHLVFGMTAPLITTSDGKKMGKSAAGAVWLNADLVRHCSCCLTAKLFFYQTPTRDAVRPVCFFSLFALYFDVVAIHLNGPSSNVASFSKTSPARTTSCLRTTIGSSGATQRTRTWSVSSSSSRSCRLTKLRV